MRCIFRRCGVLPNTPHFSVPLRAGLCAGSREMRESFLLGHPL
ncbi:MAG: hypothetical protein NTY64_16795 [Deltaproteobacteria bacterium]|nr:hypothetical protein [Deltaproteobacteria bacterium]